MLQYHPPPNQDIPPSSSTLASTEYDAMLQDVASHLSRSDLLRRLSTHSSSTSGSSKRGSTRITKQTSASNSPNYVQRRRTTANHATRSCPRASQENPYQSREHRLRSYYSSQQSMSYPRPMSWHPGSDTTQTPAAQMPRSEPALGNTIADLENLAVSGTPTSSVQQSTQNAFAMGYSCPMGAQNTTYETPPAKVQSYGEPANSPGSKYDFYPTYSVSDKYQYPLVPQAAPYGMYPTTDYKLAPQWPSGITHYSMNPQIPQPMQEYPPAHVSTNNSRKTKAISAPQLSRRKSKELVGMGLYDDRGNNFMSCVGSAGSENSPRDSVGKGLKLEETWQPPDEDQEEEEEEEDEEDEGYSSEEADEVKDVQPPLVASYPSEAQTTYFPTYRDMSNQSFFFNDDDEYTNEDQYANYFAYAQAMPEAQPKPQMNPGMENYLWF